jgi:hypothetical protein
MGYDRPWTFMYAFGRDQRERSSARPQSAHLAALPGEVFGDFLVQPAAA